MANVDPDSMQRLASRLAMLASEAGEADNAGRAVGALARRLGLTGGDLKQIFLRGIEGGDARGDGTQANETAARVAAENVTLRHSLDAAEAAMRSLAHERDALRSQNTALMAAMGRHGAAGRAGLIAGALLLGAVTVGVLIVFLGPSFRTAEQTRALTAESGGVSLSTAPPGSTAPSGSIGPSGLAAAPGQASAVLPAGNPAGRFAHVRARGAAVRDIPDTSSPIIATLPPGTHIGVRRLLWNALVQWAEVDVDGRSVYLATTDVDLP